MISNPPFLEPKLDIEYWDERAGGRLPGALPKNRPGSCQDRGAAVTDFQPQGAGKKSGQHPPFGGGNAVVAGLRPPEARKKKWHPPFQGGNAATAGLRPPAACVFSAPAGEGAKADSTKGLNLQGMPAKNSRALPPPEGCIQSCPGIGPPVGKACLAPRRAKGVPHEGVRV